MTSAKRVLLVDDETALRRSLAEQLRLHGEFAVDEVASGGQAVERLADARFDAILVNADLLERTGPEVCRTLRGAGVRCPMILLTAANAAWVPGADSGVSDCLARPFRLGVLVARLRALVTRAEQGALSEAVIGGYRFQPTSRLLCDEANGRVVRLTEKETAILGYLLRAGAVVTGRDALLGAVWGYRADVTTHTLETHVYRLRRKIEADPSNARILITEPGGYRLVP